ncbi:MAG: cytochrome c-type biogenesis protein [Anaerolineae bacterium]
MTRYLTLFILIFVSALGVYAQSDVTADDVDEVASLMFCPVCENEPLDQCYNPTCLQWKAEIRDLLAEGMSPAEIRTSFVERYGEHVVGVPQDPFLRWLSFGAPILATIFAVAVGVFTFRRWQSNRESALTPSEARLQIDDNDPYRSQIERDLM